MALRIRPLHAPPEGLPVEFSYTLFRDRIMMTKTLFVLPFALALVAGCASSSDPQSSQASADCSNLSGSALVECQKSIQPASMQKKTPVDMSRIMIHGPGNRGTKGPGEPR